MSEAQFGVHFELKPPVTHYDYHRVILGAATGQGGLAAAYKPSNVISWEVIVLIEEPYGDRLLVPSTCMMVHKAYSDTLTRIQTHTHTYKG